MSASERGRGLSFPETEECGERESAMKGASNWLGVTIFRTSCT